MTTKQRIVLALSLTALLPVAITVSGCEESGAEYDQQQATRQAMEESNRQFGMPATPSFREKRMMKEIYELRDRTLQTYTYLKHEDGRLSLVCPSIGFGLPYATQYSNPEAPYRGPNGDGSSYGYPLPQAEPNGLYMPSSAEATWIVCATEGLSVVYSEERLLVSTFELNATAPSYFSEALARGAPKDPSLTTLNEGIEGGRRALPDTSR